MRDYLITMGMFAAVGSVDERGLAWIIGAILGLPAILWTVKLFLGIRRELRENPPPSEKFVAKESMSRMEARLEKIERDMRDTATKSELWQIDARFKSFECEIRKSIETLDDKSEQRALKMHGRTNEILAAVSRLQGKLDK